MGLGMEVVWHSVCLLVTGVEQNCSIVLQATLISSPNTHKHGQTSNNLTLLSYPHKNMLGNTLLGK